MLSCVVTCNNQVTASRPGRRCYDESLTSSCIVSVSLVRASKCVACIAVTMGLQQLLKVGALLHLTKGMTLAKKSLRTYEYKAGYLSTECFLSRSKVVTKKRGQKKNPTAASRQHGPCLCPFSTVSDPHPFLLDPAYNRNNADQDSTRH